MHAALSALANLCLELTCWQESADAGDAGGGGSGGAPIDRIEATVSVTFTVQWSCGVL